ncbi:hybrid sensor histidine kinase/response regulator [Burkholderia sp. 8Y]|uniref:hybrid sensor histidine kinase/response regulator n=1 Tax=Burkholderia sp. 8Y TaxID=2653133 RepID=UPI0013594449|nr:ATP-binding protein [Burkholderia sp. 8Y]
MDGTHQPLSTMSEAYEHAPCGLVSTTTDGTIVRVNATFCRWTGYQADELLDQRRIQDLLTIGGKVFQQTHLAPLLQMQRSVAEVKLEIRRRDGRKVPMLINAVRRTVGETEQDDFACIVVNDRHKYEVELLHARRQAEEALEARTAAEEALQRADRHKDEFLATLAHELRNPLAPIQAAVRLLTRKAFADEQLNWSTRVLERQVAQLGRLVDDMLDVSRIAEGKLEVRKQRISLATAIDLAVEGVRDLIRTQSHHLRVDLPDAPLFVNADPTRLTQIVLNLLNNAAKYTPPGGTIDLAVRREGDELAMAVRDTGIGIAPEHLDTLFDIFSQLPEGHSRSGGGLGIGLSLVRALTEQHGGTVTVTSAGVGMGSEFIVRLPLSSDQTIVQNSDALDTWPPRSRRRILVVDDSEDSAVSLAMLLEADDYETHTAADGHAALRLAFEFQADVLLVDIGLPDMSGYDVARQILRDPRSSGMLLIALTGWAQERDIQAARDAGFHHHLAKPVDYRQLLQILK